MYFLLINHLHDSKEGTENMASSARIPLHPYLTKSKRTFSKYTLCCSPFSSLFLLPYIYLQSKWKVNGFQQRAPLSRMFEACQCYVCMSNYTIHCSRTTRFVLYNAQRLLTVGGIVWLLVMGAFCSLVTQPTICIAIQQTLPLFPLKTNESLA